MPLRHIFGFRNHITAQCVHQGWGDLGKTGWSVLGREFPAAESPNPTWAPFQKPSVPSLLTADLKHLGLGVEIVLKVISSASWRLFWRTPWLTWFTWGQLYPWHLNFLNMQTGLSSSRLSAEVTSAFHDVPWGSTVQIKISSAVTSAPPNPSNIW